MSKVILLGPAYPLRGGLASYNERLARAFKERGDEVKIHTFSLQYPSILFPGKTQISSSPPPEGLDIEVSVNSINPLNWWKVGNRIKNDRPDLLVIKFWLPFMGPCFGTIARRAKKNKHTRVVCIVDNIIPHEKRPGDRPFTNYFVKPVDGFIAQSKSVQNDLQQFTSHQPVIYNPHPLFDNFGQMMDKTEAKKALGLDPQYHYLLFFGFIREYKGLDLVLKAMADPRLKSRPVKLIVAGEYYDSPAPYKAIIEDHGLHGRVIEKTAFIPDEEVARYFSACDLVVQPYKNATQSGVTQIAYHFNKPMIVTDVGGLPEIVPHEKVGYVTPTDPRAIATAIDRFYEENREAEFTAYAAEEKKKYSWASMVENIYRVSGAISS